MPQKIYRRPSRNAGRAARVKWCGKSAPRGRQRRRQGKPHREQDQVGAAGAPERFGAPGEPSRRRSGRSHEALGDERPRGMAIPVFRQLPGGGTEPGLHAVWRHLLVDRSADRIGISAVSGGQPCGSPFSLLPVGKDRVASLIVWPTRSGSRPWPRDRECSGGYARRSATLRGEGAGDPSGSPVPFGSYRAYSLAVILPFVGDWRHHGERSKFLEITLFTLSAVLGSFGRNGSPQDQAHRDGAGRAVRSL